jgi:peptidoglycan/xylan/chitin deacetylase (PgdA/CDA1 family)
MAQTMMKPILKLLSPSGVRGRLLVFTYHRVFREHDPLLADEPDAQKFARQLDWIKHHCNVLPLPEAARRLNSGSLPARAACITFDDGYANNLEVALPLLQQRGLTATIFVAIEAIESGIMWNDLVIEAIRQGGGRLPATALSGCGIDIADAPPGAPAVDAALTALKYQPLAERWQIAARLYRDVAQADPPRLMLTPAMISELAAAGMDIGAHTVNHPILRSLSHAEAMREIRGSSDWIARLLGAPPRSFAYPNGRPGRDYDSSHVDMVRECGFEVAVSTAMNCAKSGADLLQLPRLPLWDRSRTRFGLRLAQIYAGSYMS